MWEGRGREGRGGEGRGGEGRGGEGRGGEGRGGEGRGREGRSGGREGGYISSTIYTHSQEFRFLDTGQKIALNLMGEATSQKIVLNLLGERLRVRKLC